MIVIYLAAICPKDIFHKVESEISTAAYKYNRLLAEGIANIEGITVNAIVPSSIIRRLDGGVNLSEVVEKNVKYIFPKTNGSQLHYIVWLIKYIVELKKNQRVIIICDALSISSDSVCILLHWIKRIENVCVVTDLPQYVGDNNSLKKRLRSSLTLRLMRMFQKYVLITKQMSNVINKKDKPQCIIEGVCELQCDNSIANVDRKKICMYAGSLHKEYGIIMLINAFISANVPGYELHIYGKGNCEPEIVSICNKHSNIIFKGQQPLDDVVKAEHEAMLLINPRPTDMEYTKYSFPSKNMEYMASGTPLLTTNLPGMPEEYKDYVYLFDMENQMAYTKKIKEILTKPDEELIERGKKARRFVTNTRNNIIQAEKIISML